MASISKRGDGWQVRWRELKVTVDEKGETSREWIWRKRQCPTHDAAKKLSLEVETAHSLGDSWKDKREQPKAGLRMLALAYVRAAVDAGTPVATQRFRSAMIGGFLDFLNAREEDDPGADTPVTELSLSLLERFANSLPNVGRQAQTRYRKVMEVEKLWAWAFARPERFPGVPFPRRYTGGSSDADKLSAPPPVVAVAAPTWAELDRMISHLGEEWHRRAAILMRFTGLRTSQTCGLDWKMWIWSGRY